MSRTSWRYKQRGKMQFRAINRRERNFWNKGSPEHLMYHFFCDGSWMPVYSWRFRKSQIQKELDRAVDCYFKNLSKRNV